MNNLSNEFISAAIAADPAVRKAALRVLRGQAPAAQPDRSLFLSMQEAARLLRVSRTTVWTLIRMGKLKKTEIYPGFNRLRRADVEAIAGGAS